MEVNGETERREQVEEEEEQVHHYYYYFYYSILNSICSAFNKALEAILKCLGLDSSTEEEEEVEVVVEVEEEEDLIETETVEETGLMKKVTGFLRRRPRPPFSSGRPGQIN